MWQGCGVKTNPTPYPLAWQGYALRSRHQVCPIGSVLTRSRFASLACAAASALGLDPFPLPSQQSIQRAKPFLSVLSRFDGGKVDFHHAKHKTRLNRRYEPLEVV